MMRLACRLRMPNVNQLFVGRLQGCFTGTNREADHHP